MFVSEHKPHNIDDILLHVSFLALLLPLLFKRVRYSKKLAEKCSAALKSVMFKNDFDNFNKKCRR